jgi:hypothetical protein
VFGCQPNTQGTKRHVARCLACLWLHLGPTAHVLRRVSGSACAVLCRGGRLSWPAPLGPNRTRASAGVWVSLCCALSRWQTVVACSTCAQPHTCFGGCLGQPVLCFVEVADCRSLLHLRPTAHVLRRVSGSACTVLCRGGRLSWPAPLGPNRTRPSAGVWVSLCCALSRQQTVFWPAPSLSNRNEVAASGTIERSIL